MGCEDLNIIPVVGDRQLLEVRKHKQNFLNRWPETLKLMKTQRHIADFFGFFFTILRRRKSARTILQFRRSTEQYLATCGDFIQQCQVNPHFLIWLLTEDECSVFLYIPVTKHQSMEWRTESSPKSKTFRCHKSRLKVKCITRNGV
jgi:hypothetical protein